MRAPCPESHLASRNARVLCPKGEIDRDTEFYKKVQDFRNERAKKNLTGDVSVKLYIPGRIIHLVDTKGDETKYVPYWASRYEFNQVILSGRMLADHSMPPLVDILRTLNLDDIHEVNTWHIDEKAEEEEYAEVRLVAPFSNPQGKLPLTLVVLAIIATILGMLSNQGCNYVTRSTIVQPVDGGSPYPGIGLNTGLWSYNLKQCVEGESCNTTDPYGADVNLEDSSYCQLYSQMFTPDTHWRSARVFASLALLLGILGIGLISIATCTKLRKRTWIYTCTLFLVVTLFQGLTFLYLKSDMCTEWTHPDTKYVAFSECTISEDGRCGIASTVLWFITAVGCAHMARVV